jgi:hypothetical protein
VNTKPKDRKRESILRDKKGPSKFCGNTHSSQMPKELVLGMPVGVMWINQDPTENEEAMEKRIREAVPSVRIQWSQAEVALLILATPAEQAQEVETKLATSSKSVEMEKRRADTTASPEHAPQSLSPAAAK